MIRNSSPPVRARIFFFLKKHPFFHHAAYTHIRTSLFYQVLPLQSIKSQDGSGFIYLSNFFIFPLTSETGENI